MKFKKFMNERTDTNNDFALVTVPVNAKDKNFLAGKLSADLDSFVFTHKKFFTGPNDEIVFLVKKPETMDKDEFRTIIRRIARDHKTDKYIIKRNDIIMCMDAGSNEPKKQLSKLAPSKTFLKKLYINFFYNKDTGLENSSDTEDTENAELQEAQEYIKSLYSQDKEIEMRHLCEAGAGLSRVLKIIKDKNMEFALISAFRKYDSQGKPLTLKENQKRNNQLIRRLREILGSNAYGALRMIGHWKECSVSLPQGKKISDCAELGGKIENCLEETWMVLNDQDNPNFFNALMKVAQEFDQDGFVARINKNLCLFSKHGEKWEDFGEPNEKSIKRGFAAIIDVQGYTELRKIRVRGRIENIVFEPIENTSVNEIKIYLTDYDQSISSMMLKKAMNLL